MRFPLIFLAIISFQASAEIPHIFSPGTKAKAADVNANFSYVDKELENIKSLIFVSRPGGDNDSCQDDSEIHTPYTYSHTPAELGTSIYLNETEYRLVKYPIKDEINGDIYHITIPKQITKQYSPTETDYVRFYVSENSTSYKPNCGKGSAFGVNTYFNYSSHGFTLNRSIYYSNDGDDDNGVYADTAISEDLQYVKNVYIGNISFHINAQTEVGSSEKIVSNDDYDFTDDTPNNAAFDYTTAASELANFLNYIHIEKVDK